MNANNVFLALCALNGADAWDTYGNGFKAQESRPHETQTTVLICGQTDANNPSGASGHATIGMPSIPGCDIDQSTAATRTWGAGDQADTWDYITVAGGYPQGPPGIKPSEGMISKDAMAFPIIVFIFYGLWVATVFAWSFAKAFEGKVANGAESVDGGDKEFKGFKTTSLGQFCFYVYHSFTAVWIGLFIMLLCDT